MEVVDDKDIIIEREKRDKYINYLEEVLKMKIFDLLDVIGKKEQLNDKFIYLVINPNSFYETYLTF